MLIKTISVSVFVQMVQLADFHVHRSLTGQTHIQTLPRGRDSCHWNLVTSLAERCWVKNRQNDTRGRNLNVCRWQRQSSGSGAGVVGRFLMWNPTQKVIFLPDTNDFYQRVEKMTTAVSFMCQRLTLLLCWWQICQQTATPSWQSV